MKWACLPIAGGLYDQDPQLLREWQVVFEQQSIFQKEEHERQTREAKAKKPGR